MGAKNCAYPIVIFCGKLPDQIQKDGFPDGFRPDEFQVIMHDEKRRKLTREFREFLDARSAWPLQKQYPAVLRNFGGGRKVDISRMKAGKSVPPKFIRALIKLLMEESSLQEFAASQSIRIPESSIEDWVAIVSTVEVEANADQLDAKGWLEQGISGLVDLFTRFVWGPMLFEEMLCRSEADAAEAACMTFETVGRQIGATAKGDDAVETAEKYMGIRLADYQSKVIEWWTVDNRVVLFATVDRIRVGCSIVLPVKESSYRSIQRGDQLPYHCDANSLETPTSFIVLESLAERHVGNHLSNRRISAQQLRTLFLQVALLTKVSAQSDLSTNVLAFSGTRENGLRLKRFGFTTEGRQLPKVGLEIWEMDSRKTWLTHAVLKQMQKNLGLRS